MGRGGGRRNRFGASVGHGNYRAIWEIQPELTDEQAFLMLGVVTALGADGITQSKCSEGGSQTRNKLRVLRSPNI